MQVYLLTLFLSFILIFLSLIGLGISYLLTGKNRLRGSCGGMKKFLTDPNRKNHGDCPICGKEVSKDSNTN